MVYARVEIEGEVLAVAERYSLELAFALALLHAVPLVVIARMGAQPMHGQFIESLAIPFGLVLHVELRQFAINRDCCRHAIGPRSALGLHVQRVPKLWLIGEH